MARLQDVLALVLRDVLSAQHQANLLTESLAGQYKAAGVLRQLCLPAVTIGDMELSLRFAIAPGIEQSAGQTDEEVQSMEVIVDAEHLAALPENAVHCITLKVSAQDGIKTTES